MSRPTDAALLQELAAKTVNDSAFALNTNDLEGAAKRLRDALGYVDRLIKSRGAPGIQGNAGLYGDEFAGYNINDPMGKKAGPLTANAGAGEFDGYSINAL